MKNLLAITALSFWVVYGYDPVPKIVQGPYSSLSACSYAAAELNRINMTFAYRCQSR